MDKQLIKYISGDGPRLQPPGRDEYNAHGDTNNKVSGDAKVSGYFDSAQCDLPRKQSGDDHNALQCELIGIRRTNDALVMENHKFRVDLSDAHEKLASLQRRTDQTSEHLQRCLDVERSAREKDREERQKLYEERFEKIRSYTLRLLQDMKLRYQTRISVLQSKMQIQAKEEEKARHEVEGVWQQRMDAYRNDLTAQFNELLKSVQHIQEDKRKSEESFVLELQTCRSLIDNLQLEARMWKDKYAALETTMDKFRENNLLLRDKLATKEEMINQLSTTVKEGIEERKELEEMVREFKKTKPREGMTKKLEALKPNLFRTKSNANYAPTKNKKSPRIYSEDSDHIERLENQQSECKLKGKQTCQSRGKSLTTMSSGKIPADSATGWNAGNPVKFSRKLQQPPPVWK